VDPVILDAARRGDRKACGVLLSSLQDVWFRFSLGLLRDRELAADATQETALRFLKQISTFRGQSELKTWSLGIALNVTRELKRKRQLTSDPDDLPHVVDPHDDAPESLGLSEQRERVRTLLGQLSDRQREVVLLRFFEDLSTDETAKMMKCASGTVKATLHQALRILKEKMAGPPN
jgi:RNA polymerase sigma-70 factor (ECF subfamily)